MSWGVATCPADGEPLVGTFEFRGFEFICMVCGTKYEFLQPRPAPETPELMARHDELKAQYDAEHKARREASS